MNKLKKFKNDINKCSKCGLCQSVCPIYKLTGNDCTVSRGKFVMLSGVLKGDLKLNKNIAKYLDMCSKCGKCSDFCPSGIDVCKIFETAKYEYSKHNTLSKIIFFLESKSIFNKFLKAFETVFCPKIEIKNPQATKRILYFKGCADKVSPKTVRAVKKILSRYNDIEVVEKDFDCCGVPFLSSGNLERYEEAKNYNLKLLNGNYDCILTDCASCESALKDYNADIKVLNIIDFIAQNPINFYFDKKIRVAFHKPCHLKSVKSIYKILNDCENIEFVEMKDFDECCGFAGEFALHNPKLSIQMMKNKAENIIKSKADIVLTLCPACEIGLKIGLALKRKNIPVMNIIEFLARSK